MLLVLITLLASAVFSQNVWPDGMLHEPGRCLMKHQCGPSSAPAGGVYNCLNNTLADPVGDDPEFLSLLLATCPMLYEGPGTTVCCDYPMLSTLADSLDVPRSLLSGCPACMQNFLSLWCGITCGRNQSQYIAAVQTQPINTIPHESTEIVEVAYLLNSTYVDAFYNSCENVEFSESNSKVIGTLCGTSAQNCNPAKLLNFLGSIDNDQSPFQIDMYIDNVAAGEPFFPLVGFPFQNQSNMNFFAPACNQSVSAYNQTFGACACQDCPAACQNCTGSSLSSASASSSVSNSSLPYAQINITAPGIPSVNYMEWDNSGLSTTLVPFTGMFDMVVLLEVLQLQQTVAEITVQFDNHTLSLDDICYRPFCNDSSTFRDPLCSVANCSILSPLQYFQNSKTALELQACAQTCGINLPTPFTTYAPSDPSTAEPILSSICGLANLDGTCDCGCGPCTYDNVTFCCTCPNKDSFYGQTTPSYDYHDHILYCFADVVAKSDIRPLDVNLGPCLGSFGGPIQPVDVLDGFDCDYQYPCESGSCNYNNATSFIMTIQMDDNVSPLAVQAWQEAFVNFMQSYFSNVINTTFAVVL